MGAIDGGVLAEVSDTSDWGAFQSGFLGPFVDFGVVWAVAWLVCIVAARLLSALPTWTRSTVTRRASMNAKWIGGLITAVAAAGFVAAGAATSVVGPWPALVWLAVGLLAVAGVLVLAFGMATTPWLKIVVVGSGGSTNDAWATEVAVRMRDLNADNPSGRVERPDGSDLNELVTIADRTENWAVALVGGAMSMLLNLTPWRLEVTVFDAVSGVARLRRNGRIVEDAALDLPAEPADREHPGELLVLSAAFAATTSAASSSSFAQRRGQRPPPTRRLSRRRCRAATRSSRRSPATRPNAPSSSPARCSRRPSATARSTTRCRRCAPSPAPCPSRS